jgi:hypothetical protein
MTAWTFAPMAAPVVVTARATRTCGGASTSYRRAVPIRRRGQRGGAHGRLPAISRDELDAVLDDDDERIALEQTRRTFLASFAMLTTASSSGIALASPSIPARPSLPALSASLGDQLQSALAPATEPGRIADAIRLPMILDGGTYVVQYNIGDTPCRGVVDTGSPFLTMEGRCTNYWGCLKESDARPSGYDNTYEVYGLQDDGVTRWVLGDARFDGEVVDVSDEPPVGIYGVDGSVIDAQSSSSESKSGNKLAAKQRFSFPEVLFGVTSEVTAKEGSSASPAAASPFLGLVKERAEWYNNSENNKIQIRPTFLGQTDVTSFSLDFNTDALVLSRREQIPRELQTGTMAMVDLRPLGSPVFHYAVPVEELWINGGRFKTDRPIYVVFDSGTTGMTVDRDLFYGSDLNLGVFECHMKMRCEDGSRVQIGSSLRTCTGRCLFLALPVDVPWDGVKGGKAHVIFAGLAFMFNQGSLTVDADARRLRLGGGFKGAAFL